MKLLIFLDVDGVLNHEPHTSDCGDELRKFAGEMPNGGFDLICPSCVERLNQLVKEAYAERWYDKVDIVLSSTWRRYFEPAEFTEKIGRAGFDFHVVGRTAINDKRRGQQILDYLKGENNYRWIVIDDDTYDMNLVAHQQIVTNYKTGFDNSALERAIQLIIDIR